MLVTDSWSMEHLACMGDLPPLLSGYKLGAVVACHCHVTFSGRRLPVTRSRELSQAKPGGASVKAHSFPAFCVVNPVPTPLLFF